MPQINNIEIINDDIIYAEKILLKEGEFFDTERRDFIKNLDTIDLQAVPGSGKTTALLAKLIILERKMPFDDGSGILVLSHTNTAVDEIKERIGKIAPKLFDFPNFIGTIQEFVNKFLAKPYGVNYLGIKFQHIDVDYFNSKLESFYYSLSYGNSIDRGIKSFIDRNNNSLSFLQSLILDKKNNLIKGINGGIYLKGLNSSNAFMKISEAKNIILNSGIISYDEAYFYGDLYIQKNPKIKKIIQNRFKYVFIDEMQDMQKHQVDILEDLFFDDGNTYSKMQRIGDTNQAIYDGKVSIDNIWKGRDEITGNPLDKLKIIGSHRFTENIACVVKNFGLTNYDLIGKRIIKNSNEEDISMKPILLVYNNTHLNNLEVTSEIKENKILEKFSQIIKRKKDDLYFGKTNIISKAIIWNAKPQDLGFKIDQCRAKHYFYDYNITANKSKNKIWFKSYKDYLFYYDKKHNTFKSKYNNLINLFLSILRDNEFKNPVNNRNFNKTTLLRYLKETSEKQYLEFKTNLYNWSRELNHSNIDEISENIDSYFPNIMDLLPGTQVNSLIIKDLDISDDVIFISGIEKKEENIYSNNGIDIKVCNVHSIKGETHTCTLYLETCYSPPSRGDDRINKGYESIRLKKRFSGDISSDLTKTYDIQSSKMLYVGLSRPTHLLCYAIHENRYNELIAGEGNETKLLELWDKKNIGDI